MFESIREETDRHLIITSYVLDCIKELHIYIVRPSIGKHIMSARAIFEYIRPGLSAHVHGRKKYYGRHENPTSCIVDSVCECGM